MLLIKDLLSVYPCEQSAIRSGAVLPVSLKSHPDPVVPIGWKLSKVNLFSFKAPIVST
jgi:hypothetical protein